MNSNREDAGRCTPFGNDGQRGPGSEKRSVMQGGSGRAYGSTHAFARPHMAAPRQQQPRRPRESARVTQESMGVTSDKTVRAWSGQRESNPHEQLGKLPGYHYIMPAEPEPLHRPRRGRLSPRRML